MRKAVLVLPFALVTLAPMPAAAQFGRVLGTATELARNAATSAATQPRSEKPRAEKPADTAKPAATGTRQAANTYPTTGPEPWPINLNKGLKSPYELKFSEELVAQKEAYHKFGFGSCSDCEGGKQDESYAGDHMENRRENNPVGKTIGKMAIGQSFSWRGPTTLGKLTVVSEGPVGPFTCRDPLGTQAREDQRHASRSVLHVWRLFRRKFLSPFRRGENAPLTGTS